MRVNELIEFLENLPSRFNKSRIYIQMQDESEAKDLDPSLLQDISEVVLDIEDDVIIIRAVRWD
jgi:hypothetical protein